ncbi:hypothetical protein VPH35_026394 [Triticum aestivum]
MANGMRSSASVSVSRVAFVLAAVAFLSLFSATAVRASSSPLFILSDAIFLFLAADCRCWPRRSSPGRASVAAGICRPTKFIFSCFRDCSVILDSNSCCFFSGVCSVGVATPSTSDDVVITDPEMPSSTIQVQPCRLYCCSNTKSASADCSGAQGRREEAPVWSRPETAGIEAGEATIVTLETAPESAGIKAEEDTIVTLEAATCRGLAQEEVEKLEMDELNRKFEDFIQSRRIKWLKEEAVLQCQQQQIV